MPQIHMDHETHHCNCTSRKCRGATNCDSAWLFFLQRNHIQLNNTSDEFHIPGIKQAVLSSQKKKQTHSGHTITTNWVYCFPSESRSSSILPWPSELDPDPNYYQYFETMCPRSWPANKPCSSDLSTLWGVVSVESTSCNDTSWYIIATIQCLSLSVDNASL